MSERERLMRIGGAEIFVRDIGEGRPVLLINGIGANVTMWGPLERAMSGLRIVSFDAPGTGRSRTPVVPFTMPRLATLAEDLLDRLELPQADVVGYSFGGAVAQQLALQAPERVRRLVLAATLPGWGGVPGQLAAMLSMGTPLRYYSRNFYERTAGTIAGGRARYDRAHVRRLWRERALHAPSPTGYAQQLWAMTMWTCLARLGDITPPTLILAGDDDPLVPLSNAMMMAARIPDARLSISADEGHFLLLDETSSALERIYSFLAAGTLDEAPVWQTAERIDSARAEEQIHADGLGALPWGAISALYRQATR